MTKVAITQHNQIARAIEDALSQLDLRSRVRGKLVAVKPNDTWASAEDRTAVTQPDTLRAVLQYLKRLGPRELIVTGGSGAAQTEDVFRISGLMDVVRDEGVQFFDHNRAPFCDVELAYAPEKDVDGPQKVVLVNKRVLEYDTLVAVNQLKLHETATVTLALKNIAMSYPAADYYGYPRSTQKHPHVFFEDIHSFIAAMAERFPIDLAVTVGHPAMIGTGPIGGVAIETGICIASTDPLAADVVGAKLLGFDIQGVRHLWEAERLGVGDGRIDGYSFPALSLKDAIGRFTEAVYGHRLHFQHA